MSAHRHFLRRLAGMKRSAAERAERRAARRSARALAGLRAFSAVAGRAEEQLELRRRAVASAKEPDGKRTVETGGESE